MQVASGISQGASAGSGPGGGIGAPIGTPDPLTSYKGWILGALALGLAVTAAFLLRRKPIVFDGPNGSGALQAAVHGDAVTAKAPVMRDSALTTSVSERNSALLHILKEELFEIESEKIAGTLPLEEYTQIKMGLEAVLRRALRKTDRSAGA
jgi:hypothetical protein